MAASLPRDASPQLQGPYDTVALGVHAGMIAAGFKLKGLREDHTIPANSDDSTTKPLPAQWNDFPSTIRFRYTHNQSSMEFIIKVDRLGGKATIDGIALGDDKRASFDITVKDFISEGNLPATPVTEGASTEEASRALQDVFISAARLSDLGAELKVKVIQKLIPGLSKEGYEESEQTTDSASGRRDPRAPYPREPEQPQYDPLRHEPPPARPRPFGDPNFPPGLEQPPGWEDPLDTFRGPRGAMPGGRNPLGIGHDDLYPPGLGPNDPFRPSLGPGGLPRPGGGGGMHPTFDDPLFGGHGGEGRRGDPQAPDGARYDPIFPGDPRGGPSTFPGAGHRGPGGAPPNPFGGYGSGDFI
jgi:hypothetical protein